MMPISQKNRIPDSLRALICLILTLGQGYSFGFTNHSDQLPMIRYFQGHNLLHNDLLLHILPAYTTYFYKAFYFIPLSLKGVEVIFLGLYLVSFYLFFKALIKLFDLIGGDGHASFLACMAIAIGILPSLGLSPWQLKLDHSIPGLAMAAWALYYFIAGRETLAFALLGLDFNIHGLYSAHLFILFFMDMTTQLRQRLFSSFFKPLLAFLVLASPVIIWKFLSMGGDDEVTGEWVTIIVERLAGQVFVSQTSSGVILHYFLFLAMLFILCRKEILQYTFSSYYSKALFLCGGTIFFCLLQFVLADKLLLRFALEGQFWRASQWMAMIGLFFIFHRILSVYKSNTGERAVQIAFICTVAMVLTNTRTGLGMALIGYVVLLKFRNLRVFRVLNFIFLIVFLRLILGEWDGLMNESMSSRLQFPGGSLATYFFAITVPFYLFFLNKKPHRLYVSAFFCFIFLYIYTNKPVFESINGLPRTDWRELQGWVKENTPKEATLITPPTLMGFRVLSDRAIVGEYKDGGMVNNNKKFAFEWRDRMNILGIEDLDSNKMYLKGKEWFGIDSQYDTFGAEEFKKISNRYGARWVVTRYKHKLPFVVQWQNEKFNLYLIN